MHVALICHCHLADEVGVCGISVYTKTTWHNNVAVQNADGTRKRNYKRPAHYADGWYGTIWCAKMTRVKVPRLDLKHSTLGWKRSVHRVWQLFTAKPSEHTHTQQVCHCGGHVHPSLTRHLRPISHFAPTPEKSPRSRHQDPSRLPSRLNDLRNYE
ncbi:hypothetical protein MCOR02_009545 [Pyricularia oryzae]|nr:hypothetical protein MCOR02_009545 [Pyricularia oryzae]KAI6253636.1 hypothetical protein MCOR19_009795 [Pyricularia oryzae]KAI6313872.1 hypothetical protein MCOR30_010117 [Pyricularia oryzae]KAI6337238.1 hypothetical protein MCOR28_008688 [Pyricularia oryzae]KAI6396017.1 hypothetical protein MCOR24_009193 [Pyricularia oryzae]